MKAQLVTLAVCCVTLAGCGQSSDSQNSAPDAASSAISVADLTEKKPATPNYIGQIGAAYYYQTSGEPVGFVFQGQNSRGLNIIMIADRFGHMFIFAGCADPCRTILMNSGEEIAYDNGTVVGRVFEDIANGFIKPVQRHLGPGIVIDPSEAARNHAAWRIKHKEGDLVDYDFSGSED